MFHWICPECGREIAPTVRECPACDPAAVTVESARAGDVEAPARALELIAITAINPITEAPLERADAVRQPEHGGGDAPPALAARVEAKLSPLEARNSQRGPEAESI